MSSTKNSSNNNDKSGSGSAIGNSNKPTTKVDDTIFVTFAGDNLNSFGDSKLEGIDGFKHSILKSLFRSLRKYRSLICLDYGELLSDECN